MNFRKVIRKLLQEEVIKKSNIKILYLHGLGSNPESDHVNLLEPLADFIVPRLDYRKRKLYDDLCDLIKNKKPKAIIGHSLGGFLAYHLAIAFDLPCLLFNPAFNDPDADRQLIPTESIDKKSSSKNNYAIVGTKDDIVPTKNQLKFLNKTNYIIIKKNIDHEIPDDIKYDEIKKFLANL